MWLSTTNCVHFFINIENKVRQDLVVTRSYTQNSKVTLFAFLFHIPYRQTQTMMMNLRRIWPQRGFSASFSTPVRPPAYLPPWNLPPNHP